MSKETKPEIEELEPFAPCENCEDCETCEDEAIAEVVADEPKRTVEVVKSYIAKDGDTYASIAAELAPKGSSKHEFAVSLMTINKNKPVVAGAEIKVK